MNDAAEILKFDFPIGSFSKHGITKISNYLTTISEIRISKLEGITKNIGENMYEEKSGKNLKEVFLKFKKLIRELNFEDVFDRRELRTLTYALDVKSEEENSIFKNSLELQQALTLFHENWRDSYMPGLLRCYLSNWVNREGESFNLIGSFITEKVNNYKGTRSLIINLKSNLKYFDTQKGDLELGTTLALKNLPLSEITNFLSLPEQWITYSYFSGVINGYIEKSKRTLDDKLVDIEKTLLAHSNSTKGTKTDKIIISKIICFTENSSEIIQDKVKDIAFNLVGDPGISSLWRPFEDMSVTDKQTIAQAREILNEWITRQFINVFFEKCINDYRRKLFWLKYSKNITRFKVYGPLGVKRILKDDERISKYVDGRFQVVNNKRDVSAFMFLIGEHKMIEFSDPGYAFYSYKNSNISAPGFDIKDLKSVDELRNGSMPQLVYRKGYDLFNFSEEGRLAHHDGQVSWEDVFAFWINKMTGIDV